jgi:DNA-binding transcriptional MocR family regulator
MKKLLAISMILLSGLPVSAQTYEPIKSDLKPIGPVSGYFTTLKLKEGYNVVYTYGKDGKPNGKIKPGSRVFVTGKEGNGYIEIKFGKAFYWIKKHG